MMTCFIWTGTFLHDLDQLGLSFFAGDSKQTRVVHVHSHHHGHEHGHSHFYGSKREVSGGTVSSEIASADIGSHGHDPSMLRTQREAAGDHNPPAAISGPYYGRLEFILKTETLGDASNPRPPPKTSKVPIYLTNRAILI